MKQKNTPSSKSQQALDQRGLKTLALWIVWAAVCTSVFVELYHQADIWNYVRHDNSHVTWVIIAAFLLGTLVSFIHTIFLTREWFCAYRLVYQLRHKGLHGIKVRKAFPEYIVSRMVQGLQHIDQCGGQVDLNALTTVEFSAHIRSSRLVNLIGSLLITLGLIGTVLGLTITPTGLNGALESVGSDGMSVLIGLREAMSGMGLAFYTTLLGSIMGGVLLRVFAHITDNSIESLQDLMVRHCMVFASANLSPSIQRDFQALDYVVDGMQERIEGLKHALQESKLAMADFAEEMQQLKDSTRLSKTDDDIFKSIAVHRHYAKILRYELSLQKQLASFKQRLLASMGFQSSKNKTED